MGKRRSSRRIPNNNRKPKRRLCNDESTKQSKQTKRQKIIQELLVGNQIVEVIDENDFKKEENKISKENQAFIVNGYWDTPNSIPITVNEMHNISTNDAFGFGDNRDFLNPSPRGSDSGIEADCSDQGNLSWLLNYKIHELPPVPDVSSVENGDCQMKNEDVVLVNNYTDVFETNENVTPVIKEHNRIHRYSGPKKPPFTYTELIEHALNEKGELTVSGIYQWISEHFPFYRPNDDRWKNSVRHNLSINPHFRKGGKAVHGAGHLWTLAQKDDKKSLQIRERMEAFFVNNNEPAEEENEVVDTELQIATASILGEFEGNNDVSNNGIEVEFIDIMDVSPEYLQDFLSPPVSKQQLVQECGLGHDFLISDMNPNTLGLNLVEGEVVHDGNFYDGIPFEYSSDLGRE